MNENLTPLQRYMRDIESGRIQKDYAQVQTIQLLDNLYQRLVNRNLERKSLLGRMRYRLGRGRMPEQGLYLWGGVGRGKTYLMDAFFESLPFESKLRMHFYRFMQRVHESLNINRGEKNPLKIVADEFANETLILCFDEFLVNDIGDAMILAGLIDALFDRGVSLVTTSNLPPEELYRDGLQRSRFLPAITLLQDHLRVVHLDSDNDYRFRALEQVELFYSPINENAGLALENNFIALLGSAQQIKAPLEINRREIRVVRRSLGVVWFRFETLCMEPRSASDYVEIAREHHTVLIESIPIFSEGRDDVARRFINLVDEFYDRNVKLIATFVAPPEELYQGYRLSFEFERTVSRLQEMRSREYLQSPHRF